ncbi:SDR family NAD(P)-dependent oxidoreductase [Bradyrhizobium sp. TM239]|uniref:SDR family NAD(P)-dependent oxidoreductase n=1 Tax=Bradyrhizobium sp. TM239 TaxID=2599802 RepID=UPI0030C6F5F6
MTPPLQRPPRKGVLKRTRTATLPPNRRSRAAHALTKAAAESRFALQCCSECNTFAYPPRDCCPVCLSTVLPLRDAPNEGVLVSDTLVRVPADVYFRERAPWRIGLVHLDCGPIMVAHVHGDCHEGEKVRMSLQLDKAGQAVAFAAPTSMTPNSTDDAQWRELTADPRFRRVLVTNGRSEIGQEIALALVEAGASNVFVGVAQPWKPFRGEDRLVGVSGIQLVPLDLADEKSVFNLAADIAGRTDIVVNTAEHIRPGGLLTRNGVSHFRDEIEQSYIGFVHLAQAFGPVMRIRGADGTNSAAAWVNIFSVYSLANWPAYGAYSASQAAVLSLSHCLRSELQPGGIRVMNVFTGPLDTEWYQTLPPPKVAPKFVADSVVRALRSGTEEVFVGDVAEDLRRRLAANPKALERELGL